MNNSTTAGISLVVQPQGSGRIVNVVTVRSDLADFRATNDLAAVASTVVDPGEFLNSGAIILADAAPSLPNPSVITVSGLAGVISKITVTLGELSHTYPADLDVLMVGPFGQKVMLMSDAGAGNAVNGITLRFDDDAATTLSQIGQLGSGSFRPTDYEPGDVLFAPAPAGPYGTALSVFRNTNPNGNWSLFVNDDHGVDSGVIATGWRLNIQTMPGATNPTLAISRAGANLILSWPDTFSGYMLESTALLGPGAVWNPVGATVVQGGGFYSVTLSPGAGNGFYRLRGP
jgi:subtilisin-like proprotein convertase family protein